MKAATLVDQIIIDQAAGLRRLFGNRSARSISFVHALRESDSAMNVARTANILANHGHSVLIVDEHGGPASVTSITGQEPQYDLFDVFVGDCALADIVIKATARISIVPAARAAREFGLGEVDIQQRMAACMAELGARAEFVLVDGVVRHGDVSLLAKAADHLALVTRPAGPAVGETCRLLRSLHSHGGREDIEIVLEGQATDIGGSAGRTVFQNIKATVLRHLDLSLHLLGTLHGNGADDVADGLLTRLTGRREAGSQDSDVVRLRGMFSPSGLFESVV